MHQVASQDHKSNSIDMLNGPIWNRVLRFALPVAATGVLEQLFNATGVAIVGNFSGSHDTQAVAAVTVTVALTW
ncbi:MAG: hypothetical protein SO360_04860 [Bifidobacterium tsurumiense]|uniref:hypothetical protein n=1 Tax=Bifidobacterium tsurumiense TaxID=356829 RepID=UPI002A814EE7|nr:hypothetical protein [Bifidobacterium tsurumiense]MDY4678172.1 hypothetical protein [Bifidobacterium tsurumiense]